METITKNLNIAIIEDDPFYSNILKIKLSAYNNVSITLFSSGEEFMASEIRSFDLIILDLNLTYSDRESMNGKELMNYLKQFEIMANIVILSSSDDINNAIVSLKNGAIDYIIKNKNEFEVLSRTINTIKNLKDTVQRIKTLEMSKTKLQNSVMKKVMTFSAVALISLWWIV